MNGSKKLVGFIPPRSYQFKSVAEALGYLVAALTAPEASRFVAYTQRHPSRNQENLARFFPAYALAEWAGGEVPVEVWHGLEDGARDSLVTWAKVMLELNSFFRLADVENYVEFVEKKELVRWDEETRSWEANVQAVRDVLGLAID